MAKSKTSSKSKGFRSYATKKPYMSKKELIGVIIVVVVILAAFIVGITVNFDGALKVTDGRIEMAEGENWLVVNGGGSRNPRYFHIGGVGEAPEGWTMELADYGSVIPSYTLKSDDGTITASISTSNQKYDVMAPYMAANYSMYSGMYSDVAISEIEETELNGLAAAAFTVRYNTAAPVIEEPAEEAAEETAEETAEEAAEETAEETAEAADEEPAEEKPVEYVSSNCAFVEAGRYSVTLSVTARSEDPAAVPSDEAMAEYMETVASLITLEK